MPVMPGPRRLKQKDYRKFNGSQVGYTTNSGQPTERDPVLKINKQK